MWSLDHPKGKVRVFGWSIAESGASSQQPFDEIGAISGFLYAPLGGLHARFEE
tara:strand:+ start:1308 stop:1466 length:159 start_codon:yes stop_codon:yes gene_type:complete